MTDMLGSAGINIEILIVLDNLISLNYKGQKIQFFSYLF